MVAGRSWVQPMKAKKAKPRETKKHRHHSPRIQSDPNFLVSPTAENNSALRALMMLHQNNTFAGDDEKIFDSFLARFYTERLEEGELRDFLRDNPAIRRKIWEAKPII